MRRIGHLDIPGGGQVYVADGHAFIGHMKPPHGTSVIDVRDPKSPRVVGEISLEEQRSRTHNVRVVGDLMITNVELNERHAVRAAQNLEQAEANLTESLGRAPDGSSASRRRPSAGPASTSARPPPGVYHHRSQPPLRHPGTGLNPLSPT